GGGRRAVPILFVGRQVAGRVIDGHRCVVIGRERHFEVEGDRTGVSFFSAHPAGDVHGRFIIRDRAPAERIADKGVGRRAQADGEALVPFGDPVAEHGDRDRLGQVAWGEGEVAGGRGVIPVGRRSAAVRGRI